MKTCQVSYDYVKRGLDIVGAGLSLVLLSPVIGVTGILVGARLGRPILFRQHRPGKDGKIFTLYKFRTMKVINEYDDVDSDHVRITPFGHKLRSMSVDELPSLWNVLRGDMSLVGPRPLLVEYLALYTPDQARRHEVKPGITGLAQVSGRNALSWEEKFSLDVEYVDRRSFRMDVRILFETISAVVKRSGISSPSQVTAEKFGIKNDD